MKLSGHAQRPCGLEYHQDVYNVGILEGHAIGGLGAEMMLLVTRTVGA